MVFATAALLSRCSLLFSVSVASSRSLIVGSSAFSVASSRLVSSSLKRSFPPSSFCTPRRNGPSLFSLLHLARGGGSSTGRSNLGKFPSSLSSSAGDNSEDEARTGWLHNTEPKQYLAPDYSDTTTADESGGSGGFGASTSTSVADKSDEEDGEAVTGWLHNTEPKRYASAPNYPEMERRPFAEKMNDYRNHRIVQPPAVHPCGDDKKRMMVTEHKVAVPLYHPDLESAAAAPSDGIVALDRADGAFRDDESSFESRPTIDVYFTVTELVSGVADEEFAASLADPTLSPRRRAELYSRRRAPVDASRSMVYLQGGPGFGCAAPVCGLSLASSKSSWAASVLFGDVTNSDGKAFERIVLMDQRGTGRSSPIGMRRLQKLFPDLFLPDEGASKRAAEEAREYLARFRADSIVRDAEWIKEALIAAPEEEDASPPPRPWGAALGQSFGGFCLMTYLSSFVHPPEICLFTGGIAPMNTPARQVYDRLWLRVEERNHMYYERYPGDVALVKRIVRHLTRLEEDGDPARLPSGGALTARRFLQLGLALGGTPGSAFANLHSVIGSAFVDEDEDELSGAFLKRIDYEQSFDDAPLYFLLHESIYADGPSSGATGWAAHTSIQKVCDADSKPQLPYGRRYNSPNPGFDFRQTSESDDASSPTLFFGEMVFPWMAEGDFAELSGDGMRSLSELVAKKEDWSPLYDASNMRAALVGEGGVGSPKSRAASATYYGDMYVDFDCAMKLVQRGGPLEGVKVWVTNEYQHSGLRDDGATIVCKLMSMAKGTIHVPS